jgi:LemA protein
MEGIIQMKKSTIILLVVGGIALIMLFWFIGMRNNLVTLDEAAESEYKNITVQLERRVDLIPNLVNTVQGYAKHEKEIFEEVANARSRLIAAKSPADKAAANEVLTGALGRLLAIGESYPQLKADTSFVRLQDELAGTENRIAVARKKYNDSVKEYNTAIRKFPANLLSYTARDYYEVPAGKDVVSVPQVKF